MHLIYLPISGQFVNLGTMTSTDAVRGSDDEIQALVIRHIGADGSGNGETWIRDLKEIEAVQSYMRRQAASVAAHAGSHGSGVGNRRA